MLRAKDQGLHYILAIEASFGAVLQGHAYWKDGRLQESRKTGMAMIRQLSTIQRKYGIEVWYCSNRTEMAWRILEYFLAVERVKPADAAYLGV